MVQRMKFYIDGQWVDPVDPQSHSIINPSTEKPLYDIALGSAKDVDKAVRAARRAFETFSKTTREERIALLERIIEGYKARTQELGESITDEMGAPLELSVRAQVGAGLAHLVSTLELLRTYEFEEPFGKAVVVREPIGVVGMITPWNWPLNQITPKVAAALATGCTMVLKPSEATPTCALIFAEIMHDAGVPAGVFNLINGLGPSVGAAMSEHPDIDMMSFTGSTRAGIDVAQRSAVTVKRVSQELGGKSPCIVLDDADFPKAVAATLGYVFMNSGQSCNAPTRMLVPQDRMDEVIALAKAEAAKVKTGNPRTAESTMGPVVNASQWKKIQGLINKGIEEGATVVAGGPGLPEGNSQGYFVRPTVFANVKNDMTIAQEEIFGPVVAILGYKDLEEAIGIANDTPFGLAGYVHGADTKRAAAVARRIRAGNVNLNGAPNDRAAPFGGYKQSGNGREWGKFGLEEYLEAKALAGLN